MRYCDKCKVEVRGAARRCPLCQHTLSGKTGSPVYPVIVSIYKAHELMFKVMIFASAFIAVISLAINLMVRDAGFWSLFVLLGLSCFWLIFGLGMRKRRNLPKNIVYQVFVVSIISIVWDFITGWRGWSVDFIIPITCVLAMLAMLLVAWIQKIAASEYITCLVADAIFGLLPLVLYLLDLTNVVIPSILCCAISLISLIAIILFQWKTIKLELMKRFHL
ncbi:MAG: DUF6320 domain-containing protein [Oscillospiraceae bacterium]|jgi:hypothetical protein|nr:DUF6320 domain-containing protein [Oscillospiraceae bacterium]